MGQCSYWVHYRLTLDWAISGLFFLFDLINYFSQFISSINHLSLSHYSHQPERANDITCFLRGTWSQLTHLLTRTHSYRALSSPFYTHSFAVTVIDGRATENVPPSPPPSQSTGLILFSLVPSYGRLRGSSSVSNSQSLDDLACLLWIFDMTTKKRE